MPRLALTDRFVAGLHVTSRVVFFDSKARGLALRATPAGVKTWVFVYQSLGKSKWLTLGAYPSVKLAEARDLSEAKRRAVDVEKRDPAKEEKAEKRAAKAKAALEANVFTFRDMAALYVPFAKGKKKTWHQDVGIIDRYLNPAWAKLPLREIKRSHVHEVLDRLVAKGMTTGVNRVQAVISRIFTVALDRSLVDAHPAVRMIKRFKEQPSDRVLTDDELRVLWRGLDAHPGPAADAIRLRMLLGQRGGEINNMLWSEVDFKATTWDMPGARTKNGRAHAVPLPPTALAILERRRDEVTSDVPGVFPVRVGWSPEYRALSEIAGGAYEWKDLRRTLSTRLAAMGFSEEVVGRVLNHARYSVTARHYIKHSYLAEVRRALEAWDRELMRILSEDEVGTSKVVSFRS